MLTASSKLFHIKHIAFYVLRSSGWASLLSLDACQKAVVIVIITQSLFIISAWSMFIADLIPHLHKNLHCFALTPWAFRDKSRVVTKIYFSTYKRLKAHFRLVFVIVYRVEWEVLYCFLCWNHTKFYVECLFVRCLWDSIFDDNIDIIRSPFKWSTALVLPPSVLLSPFQWGCLLIWILCSHRQVPFPVVFYQNASIFPFLHPNFDFPF